MASNRTHLGWALPLALVIPQIAMADWPSLLQQADELDAGGRHQEAAERYQTILAEPQPQLSSHMAERIRLRLASSRLAAGDFAAARATLQPLIDNHGVNSAEARALRKMLLQIEREAERLLRSGLAQVRADADSPWGYRDLASGLKMQGRLEQAFAVFEDAKGSALDGSQALALIEASHTIGVTQAAIELARQWLQVQPGDHAVRSALLRLAVDHAPLPLALQIHSESLPLLPQPALPRYLLARRLASEQQFEAALTHFRLLLDDPLLGLDSHLEVAALYLAADESATAIALLRRAIESWPEAAPADPRRRGWSRSPYTELIRLARQQGTLDQIELDWPALNGIHGALIRANLALARAQLGLPTEPDMAPSTRPAPG